MSRENMSRETFADLLVPCLPFVRKLLYSRLRARDQAEDVLQQTLLQAFKHKDNLREQAKIKSWLWSIALNEIRMLRRRDRPYLPLDDWPALECRDRALSPLARLEQLERSNWLHAAMSTLSDRDRTAIRLRDLDGLSLVETAAAIHRSEPAAKSVHFRARRRLELALRKSSKAA